LNIVVVGGNGREIVLIERLVNEGNRVFVVVDNISPTLADLTSATVVRVSPGAENTILAVRQIGADIVFLFNESHIASNVGRALTEVCSCCCFPPAHLAYLERNKLAAKQLVRKSHPHMVPFARQFSNCSSLLDYCKTMEFAVFKVSAGNQTATIILHRTDVSRSLIESWGIANVWVEDYCAGRDISICCLFDGDHIVFLPPVMDFPYIRAEAKLIKGGGWGAIGGAEPVCFSENCLEKCRNLISDVIGRLGRDRALCKGYRGFIVGQFRVTSDSAYFIEFDIRPGEPQFINQLALLESSFTESLLLPYMQRRLDQSSLQFRNVTNITLCIAPADYPDSQSTKDQMLDQPLHGDFGIGGRTYYSGAYLDDQGLLRSNGRRICTLYQEAATLQQGQSLLRRMLCEMRIDEKGYIYSREIVDL
jgi:phosphoribosylamine-glycine ligase